MKIKAPKKGIIIKMLDVMPYDRDGMHATGRRIYAYNALVGYMTGWDEYTDGESLWECPKVCVNLQTGVR